MILKEVVTIGRLHVRFWMHPVDWGLVHIIRLSRVTLYQVGPLTFEWWKS